MTIDMNRILRPTRLIRRRAATVLAVSAIFIAIATLARLPYVSAQSTLPNGVTLPPAFLQQRQPTQAFRQPTYLSNPPSVIPIDVGRQLFVDDFLIQASTLQRSAHRPTIYSGNPVLAPGSGRDANSAFPYSDGVWYDPDTQLFKMWYFGGVGNNVAYAYSSDGKNWVKPNIADAAIPNSNLVLSIGGGRDSDTVWRDPFD